MRWFLFLSLWLITSVPALAEGTGVILQGGAITPGHAARWDFNGVLGDGGSALGGPFGSNLTELGITNTGTPLCVTDEPITSPYHQLCLGANTLAGYGILSYNAYGGAAPLPFDCIVNGVLVLNCLTGGSSVSPNGNLIPIETYGPVGTADDSVTFSTAFAASIANGTCIQLAPRTYNIATSQDLTMSGGCLVGSDLVYGWVADVSTAPWNLIHPFNHQFIINTGRSSPKGGARISGVRITQTGINTSTTLRGALNQAALFAGTGLTITNSLDVSLENVMVNGFGVGISQSLVDRAYLQHVGGDDTLFYSVDQCYDTCWADHMEAWPFLNAPYNHPLQTESAPIASFSSGTGGVVQVNLSSAPTEPFQTGDLVVIGNTDSTKLYQFPNGRRGITRIDDTHFLLTGVAYSAASATGEIASLTANRRAAEGFKFTNGAVFASNLVEFGHDTGIHYGDGTDGMQCSGCWLDGDGNNGTNADDGTIGILNDGFAQHNSFIGGHIYEKAISIKNNTSGGLPGRALLVSGVQDIALTGCVTNNLASGVVNLGGSVMVEGSELNGCSAVGGPAIYIASNATSVRFDGVRNDGTGTLVTQAPADCFKFMNNNSINCAWTPTLAATSGAPTYAGGGQSGLVTGNGNTGYDVTANITLASVGTLAGSAITINGFPSGVVQNTSVSSACGVSRWGPLTFTAGFTQVGAAVVAGDNKISPNFMGSTFGFANIPVSSLASNTRFEVSCHVSP